jgi:hypothetical protein
MVELIANRTCCNDKKYVEITQINNLNSNKSVLLDLIWFIVS